MFLQLSQKEKSVHLAGAERKNTVLPNIFPLWCLFFSDKKLVVLSAFALELMSKSRIQCLL